MLIHSFQTKIYTKKNQQQHQQHLYTNAHKIVNMQKFYLDFHHIIHKLRDIHKNGILIQRINVLMIVGINGKIVLYGLLYINIFSTHL